MASLQIERFTSWGEIFPDPAEADRQYAGFVDETRQEYTQNNTLQEERVEINPETGLQIIRFERRNVDPGSATTLQRLPTGNVLMEFIRPGDTHRSEIVPEVGNRSHDWTYDGIVLMQQALRSRIQSLKARTAKQVYGKHDLSTILFYLKGKPATRGWEDLFLNEFNNQFPQRVGYKIFPQEFLQAARLELQRPIPLPK